MRDKLMSSNLLRGTFSHSSGN